MGILWKAGSETTVAFTATETIRIARPTYEGAVLGTFGREERIMSDVWAWISYASVWTGTAVEKVAIGNSEFGAYGAATVDATPETLEAVAIFNEAAAKAAEKAAAEARVNRMVAEATTVAKGKTVTVTKGRKVPKGTTGEIFWVGTGQYGTRVGIKDAAGTVHWTAITNVEVAQPEEYLNVEEALATLAA